MNLATTFTTTLTRAWMTRSFRKFTFTDDCDQCLDIESCDHPGLYVHIPFCRSICSFCPYCKEIYNEDKCSRYIDSLIREIHMVGSQLGTKKQVTSLYFGGGTPALAADRIGEIIDALEQYFIITDGIGVELHPDNVTAETLSALRQAGVTRISIGIQSFQEKYISLLGRRDFDLSGIARTLEEVPFETVSMDLIFALPGQMFSDLRADIDLAFANGANHIAIYPFIDFSFTDSAIAPMGKKEKRKLLDDITDYCEKKGYRRDSIWTFSNSDNAVYSSMTRDNFLGFGCSATTLLRDQFKINTFSVEQYEARIGQHILPTSLTIRFTRRQRMVYYLFWMAYSTTVDSGEFERFFSVPLKKAYGFELWLAAKLGFAIEKDGIYRMTHKGAFYYHYYEGYYTLAYIDKMWGIMRKEAFPEKIQF